VFGITRNPRSARSEISVRFRPKCTITPWILAWGHNVEVLEPAELRERVAAIANGMAERYAPRRVSLPASYGHDVTR
jgi:predicted DNA-binding transcriptional regulator YafY